MLAKLGKWLFLGVVDALGIISLVFLASGGHWGLFCGLTLGLVVTNLVVMIRSAYPLRFILPGLVFFSAFVLYPMLNTAYLSITNVSTGHLLSEEQVIAQLESQVVEVPDSASFQFWAYANREDTPVVLLLQDESDSWWLASITEQSVQALYSDDPRMIDEDDDGVFERFEDYNLLQGPTLFRQLSTFEGLLFPFGDQVLKISGLNSFRIAKRRFHYDTEQAYLEEFFAYDDASRVWQELSPPRIYTADQEVGFFTAEDGDFVTPGWTVLVGFDNYLEMLQNPRVVGPFLRVFTWTFAFATASVLFTFALGLLLAVLLNEEHMLLRRFYRVILILPWAIPAFISIMVWRGLLTPAGPVTDLTESLFNLAIPWISDPFWAKAGIILINLWLGFPYMMTICLGALQGIPSELYEAAYVDGATRWRQFWKITFPLLLVSVGPLLVGSFAFNFNNFNVIFLYTGGGPPIPGAQTPAGATDILISYTYQVAFNAGWGQQYGFAAAITMGIFLIVALISAINFKLTGALEEVGQD